MLTVNDILAGVFFPALVAAVILLLPRLLSRRNEWAGPLAMAAAFVVGFPAVRSSFPTEWTASSGIDERLFFLAIPVAIVAAVLESFRPPGAVRTPVAIALIATMLWLCLAPARATWSAGALTMLITSLTIVLSVLWWMIDASLRAAPITSMIALVGINLGVGLLLMLSGVQSYGQLACAAMAGLMAALVMVPMGLCPRRLRGAPVIFIGIVGTLLTAGTDPLFGYAKVYNAALIGAAPLVLWASRWIVRGRAKAWQRGLVQITLTAIPVLIALAIAGKQFAAALAAEGSE